MLDRRAVLRSATALTVLSVSGDAFAKTKSVKTGALAKQFGKLGFGKVLIVDGEFDKNFQMSARNLSHVGLLPAVGLNVYDIMRTDKLVLTTAALKMIEERLA